MLSWSVTRRQMARSDGLAGQVCRRRRRAATRWIPRYGQIPGWSTPSLPRSLGSRQSVRVCLAHAEGACRGAKRPRVGTGHGVVAVRREARHANMPDVRVCVNMAETSRGRCRTLGRYQSGSSQVNVGLENWQVLVHRDRNFPQLLTPTVVNIRRPVHHASCIILPRHLFLIGPIRLSSNSSSLSPALQARVSPFVGW